MISWKAHLAAWSAALAVIAAASLSPRLAPPGAHGEDKLVHLAVYAMMTAWPLVALPGRRARMAAVLLLLACGAGLELLQAWVPGRTASLSDGFANLVGVGAGGMLGWWRTIRRERDC